MNKSTFKGLLSGLSAAGMLYSDARYPDLPLSISEKKHDLDNMRGDWLRIGGDFKKAIQREKSAQEKARRT
ncbi:hypothetical protein ACQE3E_13630 [Methylomonas sp. MED-D]|uniref:hypothetical protein n=1 Tax=unclassified Methylomonas TaxID=2608980 RepID=UPI0028A46791|nr:hypothetical protein [Methylomonas sp. MV1]MDT4331541.1 hypothetical protein [Methylomonas sp. MV1]